MKYYLLVAILLISIDFNASKRLKRMKCKPVYSWRTGYYYWPAGCNPSDRSDIINEKINPSQNEIDDWEKRAQRELEETRKKKEELEATRKKNAEEWERNKKKREEEAKKKLDSRRVLRGVNCRRACSKTDPSGNPQRIDKYGAYYRSYETKQLRCNISSNTKIAWNTDYCLINKSKFNKTCWEAEWKYNSWTRRRYISCDKDTRLLKVNKAVLQYVK